MLKKVFLEGKTCTRPSVFACIRSHDDFMTWKCFPRLALFRKESPADLWHHFTKGRILGDFIDVNLKKLLNKLPSCGFIEFAWRWCVTVLIDDWELDITVTSQARWGSDNGFLNVVIWSSPGLFSNAPLETNVDDIGTIFNPMKWSKISVCTMTVTFFRSECVNRLTIRLSVLGDTRCVRNTWFILGLPYQARYV